MEISLNNQSLIDLSIQHTGSVSSVVELCVLNDFSLDEIINPGQSVAVSKSQIDNQILQYYQVNKIELATGFQPGQFEAYGVADYSGLEVEFLNEYEKHVLQLQSVLDLSNQYHGTATAALELLLNNNLSIDDTINPGQIIKLENKDYGFTNVVDYYKANSFEPSTQSTSGQYEVFGVADYSGLEPEFLNNYQKHVLQLQSVLDLCSQYHGTATAALELILKNDLRIDESINPGRIVTIENKDYGFKNVVDYYSLNKIEPATAFIEVLEFELPGEFPFSF